LSFFDDDDETDDELFFCVHSETTTREREREKKKKRFFIQKKKRNLSVIVKYNREGESGSEWEREREKEKEMQGRHLFLRFRRRAGRRFLLLFVFALFLRHLCSVCANLCFHTRKQQRAHTSDSPRTTHLSIELAVLLSFVLFFVFHAPHAGLSPSKICENIVCRTVANTTWIFSVDVACVKCG
jgi:hypothetical protein